MIRKIGGRIMIKIIGKLIIPKNTPYCYTPIKFTENGYKVKHCPFHCKKVNKEYNCKMEYCRYLKDFLSVQDDVKDCGINDNYEQENFYEKD